MPKMDVAYPVGCTSIKLLDDNNDEYGVYIGSDTFTRTGEDGAEIILPLFHGDEGVGEVLEGHWRKGWTTDMDADQAFTAILDGAGVLEMEGEADVAGTLGYGWVNSNNVLPLLNGLEVTFACLLPVDDTGETADRDIYWYFTLMGTESASRPNSLRDFLVLYAHVDESGVIFNLELTRDNAMTSLWTGSDYSGAARATGSLEATIWRLVFYGKPGTSGSYFRVYLKQAATLANAELATEYELSDSPFSAAEFGFNTCYPSLMIGSQNTTYFDSGGEMKWGYVRVQYPDGFSSKYDCPDANLHLGEVELWDGDPAGTGMRVYDEDHDFTATAVYLQNGLVRMKIIYDTDQGLQPYIYIGGAWTQSGYLYPGIEAAATTAVHYPIDVSIVLLSTEKIVLKVRSANSATHDTDYYMDFLMTLLRGSYHFEIQLTDVYPQNSVRCAHPTSDRWGWNGEEVGLADDDMNISTANTNLPDNFMVAFDDDRNALLTISANSMKPDWDDVRFYAYDGGDLYMQDFYYETAFEVRLFEALVPFALVANLHIEAEDATLGSGATSVADSAASGGFAALLDAQNEFVEDRLDAGTDLPAGRYIAIFRIRDINQVPNDLYMWAWNQDDSAHRSEENAFIYDTATASYAFYTIVFDISDADVTGTDEIRVGLKKITATANEIYVDYITIIPIGDGMSFPQDVAHRCMREGKVARRVFER